MGWREQDLYDWIDALSPYGVKDQVDVLVIARVGGCVLSAPSIPQHRSDCHSSRWTFHSSG